jgi:hypothetical protein
LTVSSIGPFAWNLWHEPELETIILALGARLPSDNLLHLIFSAIFSKMHDTGLQEYLVMFYHCGTLPKPQQPLDSFFHWAICLELVT